ncbi:hypothetical protein OKW33_006121 [Paraburkholderia atlantica]
MGPINPTTGTGPDSSCYANTKKILNNAGFQPHGDISLISLSAIQSNGETRRVFYSYHYVAVVRNQKNDLANDAIGLVSIARSSFLVQVKSR